MMRICRLWLGVLMICLLVRGAAAEMTIGQTKLVFATQEQARQILGTSDEFSKAMSPCDRRMRMKTESDPGEAGYLKFAAEQARAWDEREMGLLENAMQNALKRLNEFKLSLPETVYLVRSTGADDEYLPYTRLNAIMIPENWKWGYPSMITHELFHVMSRHDRALRSQLYEVIGFRPCAPIEPPPSVKKLVITNPDAPVLEHVITLERGNGKQVTVVPVLMSRVEDYDVSIKGGLLRIMGMRFMEVRRQGKRWVPAPEELDTGSPIVPNNKEMQQDYIRHVGRIEHPTMQAEEIVACNFENFIMRPNLIKAFRERFGDKVTTGSAVTRNVVAGNAKAKPKVDAVTSATDDGPANLRIMEMFEKVFKKD